MPALWDRRSFSTSETNGKERRAHGTLVRTLCADNWIEPKRATQWNKMKTYESVCSSKSKTGREWTKFFLFFGRMRNCVRAHSRTCIMAMAIFKCVICSCWLECREQIQFTLTTDLAPFIIFVQTSSSVARNTHTHACLLKTHSNNCWFSVFSRWFISFCLFHCVCLHTVFYLLQFGDQFVIWLVFLKKSATLFPLSLSLFLFLPSSLMNLYAVFFIILTTLMFRAFFRWTRCQTSVCVSMSAISV